MKQLLYNQDGFAIHLVSSRMSQHRGLSGIDLYRCSDYAFKSHRMNSAGVSIIKTLFKKRIGYDVRVEHHETGHSIFRITDKKSQFEFILKYGPYVEK